MSAPDAEPAAAAAADGSFSSDTAASNASSSLSASSAEQAATVPVATVDGAPESHELADLRQSLRLRASRNHGENKASTKTLMVDTPDDIMQVVYKDIGFTVNVADKTSKKKKMVPRPILKGITGVFRPGRLTAILGASGAGKTSLLNVLAGEVSSGTVSGTILVNGEPVNGEKMKRISGFVYQDDVILQTQTVREAITMSAILRLPKNVPRAEKLQRVEDIIELLHLTKCADTVIGSATIKGVSGGERKRCAMAMEMVTNPSILYLDEPTSGLDTYTAYSTMETLKSLASAGRTVVATIHQPSSDIFHLFDDLIVLADGEIMYQGPASNAVEYFGNLGFPCPKYNNPADFIFMHILNKSDVAIDHGDAVPAAAAADDGSGKADGENVALGVIAAPPASSASPAKGGESNFEKKEIVQERITRLLRAYKASPEAAAITNTANNPLNTGIALSQLKTNSSFYTQYSYLFLRAGRNAMRNKLIIRAKLGQTIFIGILVGLIYLQVQNRNPASQTQDRAGSLFFLSINNVMASAMGVLSIFSAEKVVFKREYGAGYYSLPAFFLSKVTVEIPSNVLFPLILSVISYFLVGYQVDAAKFFIFSLIIILLANSGLAIGIFAACLFDDLAMALAIVPLVLLPLMIFSGLFVNNASIPPYFDWIKYISPMKYGFEGLFKNEMEGGVFPFVSTNGTVVNVPGDFLIKAYGFDDNLSIGLCIIILFAIYLALMIMAYLALFRLVWQNKRVKLVAGPTAA